MTQKLFTEWLQCKVNEGIGMPEPRQQGPDLYSARESIKNAMANMRSDPAKVLADGLQWGLQKVAGHPQATQIIRRMQDMAMQFFQEIRNKNLGIYDNRQGNVIRPRMPSQGERGFEEYQQIYLAYYDKLHRIWQGLDQLAHQ
jgi:hypothetical protein